MNMSKAARKSSTLSSNSSSRKATPSCERTKGAENARHVLAPSSRENGEEVFTTTVKDETDRPKPPSWKPTMDIDDMVTGSFQCCKTLRCVEKFVLDKAGVKRLRHEQADLTKCSSYAARTAWVAQRAPMEKVKKGEGSMQVGQTFVCNKFFAKAFGVSNNTIEAAKRNPGSAASRKRLRPGSTGAREHVLAFLDQEAKRCGRHVSHKDVTYLYIRNKKELYNLCAAEMNRVHGPATAVSPAYFYKLWKEERPKLLLKTGDDLVTCDECSLFKLTLYGPPGVRTVVDADVVAETEAKKSRHLKLAMLDKQRLGLIRWETASAKADFKPLRSVSLQVHASDEAPLSFPKLRSSTRETDKGWTERQELLGVLVEGHFVEILLRPQTIPEGSNVVCTAIHQTLTRLLDMYKTPDEQAHIEELFVQADHCASSDAKHVLLGYLGSLVARGVVGRVEVNYMMVGHTDILVDKIVSRLAASMKHANIFTGADVAETFAASYDELEVFTATLRSCGNFEAAVRADDGVQTIHGVTTPRSFELLRHGPGQATLGMKEFMHSSKYTGVTADGVFEGEPPVIFTSGAPLVEKAPALELEQVDQATRKRIRDNYEAAFPRVDTLYPGDSERQEAIKAEMMRSADLLGATGPCEWDLATWWLPNCDAASEM